MRLQISKSKNAASFYVIKSVYENGKRSNKVVEKLWLPYRLPDRHFKKMKKILKATKGR